MTHYTKVQELEFYTGMGVDAAVKEALEYAKENNVIVRTRINGTKMMIYYLDIWSMEENIDYEIKKYQARSWKQ
jgi:hypothetical protein